MSKLLKITAVVAAPVVAMTLMAAPASAQSRDRDNTGRNALIGAAVGGLAGGYYRGGQCYRNQGHWEREHGIDSNRYGYDYRYDGRHYDSRYDRRDYRQDDRRDYRYDRRW